MKKLIPLLILSLLIITIAFSGCKDTDSAVGTITKTAVKSGYSQYKSIVKELNTAAKKYKKLLEKKVKKSSIKAKYIKREMAENYYGFLCDFDKNGTKELLTYSFNNKADNPENLFSIYTVKDNKLKALVKDKKNYISYVGNERGCVGVASKNGKNYLFEVRSSSPTDLSEVRRTYNYIFYAVKNGKLAKVKTAKWIEVNTALGKKYHKEFPKAYTESQYKVGGKKVDNAKFIKYLKTFKFTYIGKEKAKEKDGYYLTSSAPAPDKLLKQVEKLS